MSSRAVLATKALVLMLIEGYPSSAHAITDATIDSYVLALEGITPDIIKAACLRFIRGEVERKDRTRAPSAEELRREAQRLQQHQQEEAELDRLYPRITNVPPGYRTVGGGRFIAVPANKPFPPGFSPRPMGKIDYGHGMVTLDGLTPREARVIENLKGILPDGRNVAMMTLDQKREAIAALVNQKALA